jgi:hypothetical protein
MGLPASDDVLYQLPELRALQVLHHELLQQARIGQNSIEAIMH